MDKPPLFILGNPRSGTSLLRLILTSHPRIGIPPECGFAVWWQEKYGDWTRNDRRIDDFLNDLRSSRKIETWGLRFDQLREAMILVSPENYSGLVSLVYDAYCALHGRAGARWGDKNNFYIRHVAEIRQMFPEAPLVHIVRDGRDVCASYRELRQQEVDSPYAPRLPFDPVDVAREWCANLQALRHSFDGLDPRALHEIRYEDLVASPRRVAEDLCAFLGEEFDERMLDYFSAANACNHEPREFLAWKRLTLQPPTTRQVGRFRRDLTADQIAAFEGAAGEMLAVYDYA